LYVVLFLYFFFDFVFLADFSDLVILCFMLFFIVYMGTHIIFLLLWYSVLLFLFLFFVYTPSQVYYIYLFYFYFHSSGVSH